MTRRKREAIRQEVEQDTGIIHTFYNDGTEEIEDPKHPKLPIAITDKQIERWKNMPKDEALREAIELFREQDLDIPERRFKLEALKFICEIQGVLLPQMQGKGQVVAIQINMDTGSADINEPPNI